MGDVKRIDGYSLTQLLATAATVVEKKTKDSIVLDRDAEERIPKFDLSELQVGRVLGRGGFCVVNEVTKITLNKKAESIESGEASAPLDDENHIHNVVQNRKFMEMHCVRSGKDCRYAIKKVQESSRKDHQTYINAVVDLAVEARFLSVVRHPNIIKMRAMAAGSSFTDTFFVVLDKLYDILTGRLKKWQRLQVKGVKKILDRGGKKELAQWVERLTAAYDLSCALKYLHDSCIVYRDIKPDNIGFDVRGDVKIFDFGLAKEFDPSQKREDGTYLMTEDTGSPRYMATEVALGKPYNQSVDVYSFCILLWEILKMETPFEGYTMSMFTKRVIEGGTRPKPDPKWPESITELLRKGWDSDFKVRPTMEEVTKVLRDEISLNSNEEIDEILDASRKSEMSLRRGDAYR